MGGSLRAGVARVALEPPRGIPMMGYGARQGVADGALDALSVRALHLESDRGAALLVECDLCLLAPQQAQRVRRALAGATGLPEPAILVGCIHTHSGPDTGLAALLGGGDEPPWVEALLEAAVRAGRAAFETRGPARLGVGHARARIGRNRARADGPLDEDVLVLRVDDADARPRAVLFVHGCHPTVLGHDNLAWSADWPGAARDEVEARLPGAIALFALGAHADVDPRTRGLLDLAISGQSLGAPYAVCRALGAEVGEAVAEVASALSTRADAPVAADACRVTLEAHRPDDAGRHEALAALGLAPDAQPGTAELFRLEQERTAHLAEAPRRAARARVRRYLRDRTAHRFAFGAVADVEVQVLRLGEARLLALPLEPTVEVGRDWRRRIGTPEAAVIGIANGWLRYLPHPRDFAQPQAEHAYEVLQSTFRPDAAERLLAAGEALLRRLDREAA